MSHLQVTEGFDLLFITLRQRFSLQILSAADKQRKPLNLWCLGLLIWKLPMIMSPTLKSCND